MEKKMIGVVKNSDNILNVIFIATTEFTMLTTTLFFSEMLLDADLKGRSHKAQA